MDRTDTLGAGSHYTANHALPRVRWGAIVAGLVTATAVQVVLSLLGLAIGLAGFDPDSGAKSFGIGTGPWTILTARTASRWPPPPSAR